MDKVSGEEKRKTRKNLNNKFAQKHGLTVTHPRILSVWRTMMHRCYDKKRDNYARYGGRGIKTSDEWKDPEVFCKWACSNGYKPGLQLDRIDNNGDYSAANCRFVTPSQNCTNKRNNVRLRVGKAEMCVSEWEAKTGISRFTMYGWVKDHGKEHAENKLKERMMANGGKQS